MNSQPLKPLFRILSQFREYYPIIVIYSVCISILTLATPISVQSLVNTFSFGPVFQPIFILSLILLGILFVLGLIKSLQYLLVEYLQRKLYAKVTASIGRAYFLESESDQYELEEKANRYFDIILIHKNLAFLVTDGVALALQTFIGLILICLYHPFFIVFSILILISITFPLFLYCRKGLSSAVSESTAKYLVADHIKDLAKHKFSQLTTQQKVNAIDIKIDEFLEQRSRHFKTVFAQNIIYISLYAFMNSLLLALGGYLVISNQLTIGQLVAAEIVVNAILSHFLYARKYLESFYDISAAATKVHIFYDLIDKHKASSKTEEKEKSFLYSRGQTTFLNKFQSIKNIYAPNNYKAIFKKFFFGIITVSTLLLITPWQQTSHGTGQVTALDPNDRVQTITATVGGIVEEWLVQDGQVVKKGDPIVRVIDNDPNYLVRLEVRRDAAIAKFNAVKEASDTGRLNFHRQEQLVKEGLSSQKDFEAAKIKYKKLLSEEASAAANLAKAEVDLSRQQLQTVTAPRDGQILRILRGSGTTNVKAGDELVEFVPVSSGSIVELNIDGNDLPLVYTGRKVRLQFEGWPAVQFSGWPSIAIGSFGGIVSAVDPSVSSDGSFRVLIKPDPDDKTQWPDQNILRQGSRTIGIVILDQVSIGYEIWRKINGFPKSMSKPLNHSSDKKRDHKK